MKAHKTTMTTEPSSHSSNNNYKVKKLQQHQTALPKLMTSSSLQLYSSTSSLSSSASSSSDDIPFGADDATAIKSSSDSSITTSADFKVKVFPRHTQETNLYLIPSDLHPVYRSLPFLIQACVYLTAAVVSAAVTWPHTKWTWVTPLVAITNNTWNVKQLVFFVARVGYHTGGVLLAHTEYAWWCHSL